MFQGRMGDRCVPSCTKFRLLFVKVEATLAIKMCQVQVFLGLTVEELVK
jgi:hypothetical protein